MASAASKAKTVEELDEFFSFTVGETRYVVPLKTVDVMTPGWVRKNRRRDETDYFMTLIEALCGGDPDVKVKVSKEDRKIGEEIIEVLDGLPWAQHREVQKEIAEHIGATMGD